MSLSANEIFSPTKKSREDVARHLIEIAEEITADNSGIEELQFNAQSEESKNGLTHYYLTVGWKEAQKERKE